MNTDSITPSSDWEYTLPPGLDRLGEYWPLLHYPIHSFHFIHQDWADWLLRSVQSTATSGNILHICYYLPFISLIPGSLPFHHSISVDHWFEYCNPKTNQLAVVISFIVSPSFHFDELRWSYSQDPHYHVPSYIFSHHSFFYNLPLFISQEIHDLAKEQGINTLFDFLSSINNWLAFIWKPSSNPLLNIVPPSRPLIPPPYPHPQFHYSTTPEHE